MDRDRSRSREREDASAAQASPEQLAALQSLILQQAAQQSMLGGQDLADYMASFTGQTASLASIPAVDIAPRSTKYAPGRPILGEDKPGSEYRIGYVSHIYAEKGYSVMTTNRAEQVLLSKTIIEPSQLAMHEAVAVRIVAQPETGHYFAIAPMYRMKGEGRTGTPVEFGDFFGLVKQAQKNGDCFVDCQEIKDKFNGRDAYLHSSVVVECNLEEGDGICFTLHVNKSGMPQVPKPVWKRCKQGCGQMSGEFHSEIHFGWVLEITEEHVKVHHNDYGDVFIHPEECALDMFAKDELLAYCFQRSKKKKKFTNTAAQPIMKFCGHPSKSTWASFGQFIGKISDSVESLMAMASGQGTFVECLAVSERCGRECFAHTSVLLECGVKCGDIICFNVHVGKDGCPQLISPVWKIMSTPNLHSQWVKCDKLNFECAQKFTGQEDQMPLLPMDKAVEQMSQRGGGPPEGWSSLPSQNSGWKDSGWKDWKDSGWKDWNEDSKKQEADPAAAQQASSAEALQQAHLDALRLAMGMGADMSSANTLEVMQLAMAAGLALPALEDSTSLAAKLLQGKDNISANGKILMPWQR